LLTDEQATRDGVTNALQQFATQVSTDDTALLFFCGHGAPGTDGVYNFGTHDAVFTADNRIEAGTGLSRDALLPLLRAITARKLLLFINACFSGHLHPGVLGAPPAATLGIDILGTGEGRALISASRPTQYSYYQREAQCTFFGQALIDGLSGQASSNGGYIGLYELYQYLYSSVKAAAAGVNGTQEPMLTIQHGVGPFPIAVAPGTDVSNLNAGAIRQEPPRDMAVKVIERSSVQVRAEGTGAQAFNKLIDFGSATMGNVTIGDVAGRDMTKIDIKVNTADAAAVNSKDELLKLIAQVQADVAALKDAPKGQRDDTEYALRKAQEAVEEDDPSRLLEKLQEAENKLLMFGKTIPAAFKLGETIGVLIQRAMSMMGS
jgi:hypothetical protein